MIQIIFTFIYILFVLLGMGLFLKKWLKLDQYNILFTILTGLFTQIILATFYASFFALNLYFYILNLLISTALITLYFTTIKKIIRQTIQVFKGFSLSSKILFLIISLLSVVRSSSFPSIPDNETYYIQTIKWLNNYGLVNGLANLHLFLGQTSGWHILQSTFNFSFLEPVFNDLNGFLVIFASFFYIQKWEVYKQHKNINDLFISLMLLANLFLFLFIDSPSPDLAIIIIAPIIVFLFIDSFQNNCRKHILLISVLSLLIILIKVTIIPILLLPTILIFRSKEIQKYRNITILSSLALGSFLIKNYIISGYPLYPLDIGANLMVTDWKLNSELQLFYQRYTNMYAWHINDWEQFNKLGFLDKFLTWLQLSGLHGILNKIMIIVLLVFPFFIRIKKEIFFVYLYCIFQFLVLYLTSPQYRFFSSTLLVMTLLILATIFKNKLKLIHIFYHLSTAFLLLLVIFGFNIKDLLTGKILDGRSAINSSQIITPREITLYPELEYEIIKIGDLEYYSPVKDSIFFWETANGPLPAANKNEIEYFSDYYNHVPQMRTNNLKNGFYSAKPDFN